MLNENQKKVTEITEGPLLVVAGPGSGKTTVVVNRVVNLVNKGIKPENILIITFTKQAANEMSQRFNDLTRRAYPSVNFGTIHSIALKILTESFGFSAKNVLTEKEKWIILQKIIQNRKIKTDDVKNLIKNLINAISKIKIFKLSPPYDIECGCRASQLKIIYDDYIRICSDNHKIDYDDMQINAYNLLINDCNTLAYWRDKFRYISVDEAQDMDEIQADLIYLLAKPNNNICIVGDDDQSLYRFRGAKPEIMLNFENTFHSKKIMLDTNYRSGSKIVETSSAFIKSNKTRFDKDFKSVKNGGSVKIVRMEDESEQAENLSKAVMLLLKRGEKPDDIAVIYRTNRESTKIISQFMKTKLPFWVNASDTVNVFEHWIFKDIVNFYQLSRMFPVMKENDIPFESIQRAIKRPSLFIPGECFKSCRTLCEMEDWAYDHKKLYITKNIRNFRKIFREMSKLDFKGFVKTLDFRLNYRKAIVDYAQFTNQNSKELLEIYDEIILSTADYNDYEDWFNYAVNFTVTLKEKISKDGVRLLTMHSSKGLEFNHVFIVNANEETTPYAYNDIFNDIEEERRMFYVAMTRARESIVIFTTIRNDSGTLLQQSRFVDELLKLPNVMYFS